jgi:acetyltransferase-like isoleucine patch superfamily enzyme
MKAAQAEGKSPPHAVRRKLQMIYRRLFWGMDIHPSAQVANTAYIDRTWPKGIHIERDAIVDEEAIVLTHDMTRSVYRDTRIGAGSYIGPRAIILPGVSVGAGAVVAAGSIVTKDVPDRGTVAGNPARETDKLPA